MGASQEVQRLATIARYGLLDTPPEAAFDRITALAAEIFEVPIALITIVDHDRIWFKSRFGLEVPEVGRAPGLCASAILEQDVWVVEDALVDPRAADNPLVTGDLGLQFYAGMRLCVADGSALGTLCLIDHEPRVFDEARRRLLADMSALVVEVVELRRAAMSAIALERQLRGESELTASILQSEVQSRRQAEEAHALMADVTGILLRSRSVEEALHDVARRTLPLLGEGAAVNQVDEAGFRTTAVAHLSPTAERVMGRARDNREAVQLDTTPVVISHVLDTHEPLVCTVEEALRWPGTPQAPELAATLEELGASWFLFVPLIARGRPIGALTFLTSSDRGFTDVQVNIADDVAARVAAAIDNARVHEEQGRVAVALQSSLLPPMLPEIPNVDLDARYRAAGAVDIGGDFYDVFRNDENSWNLLVGDVSGKGPEAAAIAGLARYSARALALTHTDPGEILAMMNVAVERQGKSDKFLTAICARITPTDDGTDLLIADAGHPPPLIRRADGTVELVELHGTALGLFPDPNVAQTTVHLGPDDLIVFYTDGATEARREGGELLGVDGLAKVLGGLPHRRAANVGSQLIRAVASADGGEPRDDLALVVLRVRPLSQGRSRA